MKEKQVIDAVKELLREGRNIEALNFIKQAVQKHPNDIALLRLMAFAHYNLAEYKEAVDVLQQAISCAPRDIYLYIDICTCYWALGDKHGSLRVIDQVVSLLPEREIFILSNNQYNNGNAKAAEHLTRAALKHYPKNVDILNVLGMSLEAQKSYEEAIHCFSAVILISPSNSAAWYNMGNVLKINGKYIEALDCLNQAVKFDKMSLRNRLMQAQLYFKVNEEKDRPGSIEALKLVSILSEVQQYVDAPLINDDVQVAFSYALEHKRCKEVEGRNQLVNYWINCPRLIPLMYEMDRVQTMQDRLDLLDLHRLWGKRITNSIKTSIKRKVRSRLNKKLRIGIITAFENNHVTRSISTIIKHWDMDRFELYCYGLPMGGRGSLYRLANDKAVSFKEVHDDERSEAVAQVIADDSLDALIDPGPGFFKPEIVAYRPAPVQINWLDYPHSSGLPIDYIMVDPYINPGEELLLEKPLMLPETWMVIDKDLFPSDVIIDIIPEDRNKYITFGTMNSSFKITPEALNLWASIMLAVPNSKFIYSRPETSMQILRDNFVNHMVACGVDPNRILFKSIRTGHMGVYNYIDIALDTFPRTGGTTTCEALWMGVPVVTLVGPAFFERLSYSNLNNCGLADLCAANTREYKEIALQLVADRQRRRSLRRNLRQQLLQSPLGQSKRFARNFTDAIANVLGRG